MYKVDSDTTKLTKITSSSFSELNLRERQDLQEWLVNNPEVFGEDLLIIQKEFDGFDGTRERLDILALDKNGNIVVIENKSDNTGKDVVWQNIKYVSYCSTLKKSEIIEIYQSYIDKYKPNENAIENLQDFFNVEDTDELIINEDQRMFFVALKYRKEVTSSVMWLLNKDIDVKCFKVTMYCLEGNLLLDMEQIIPVKEAQDYIISMNRKSNDITSDKKKTSAIHELRRTYWSQLLALIHSSNVTAFKNKSATQDHWLSATTGVSGVIYSLITGVNYAGLELYMSSSNKERNKEVFDILHENKDELEEYFGDKLDWRRLDEKIACRILYQLDDVSIKNDEDWDRMQEFQLDALIRLEKAFNKVKSKLK